MHSLLVTDDRSSCSLPFLVLCLSCHCDWSTSYIVCVHDSLQLFLSISARLEWFHYNPEVKVEHSLMVSAMSGHYVSLLQLGFGHDLDPMRVL